MPLTDVIQRLPKAELHLHIEGSLEPELMMQLAEKNNVQLPYQSIQEVKDAYQFDDLQSFLDLYYLGAAVLCTEADFKALMLAYLSRCQEDNIVHTEMMFDPQTHTQRGIGFEVFMPGFLSAMAEAKEKWGMSCQLIMCFLRHLSEEDAFATLEAAEPYKEHIIAVGLDSSEQGNPPKKFEKVFAAAKAQGYLRVAHAGEEGPPSYVWGALNLLDVQRIDHGVRSIEDAKLMAYLRESKMPLTVCPLSNVKLAVYDDMAQHNILHMLEEGLVVTVNSDDPSYFGGYLNQNFIAMAEALPLTEAQLKQLVCNSFTGSFLPEAQKQHWIAEVMA